MVTHVAVDLLGDLALVEGSDAIAGDDLEDGGELGLGKALARLEDFAAVPQEVPGARAIAFQEFLAGALLQGVLQLGDGIPLAGDADGGREDRAPGQPAVVLVEAGREGKRGPRPPPAPSPAVLLVQYNLPPEQIASASPLAQRIPR